MKKPKASSVEAVKTTYPQLAEESKQLKQAISELWETIAGIESSLRRIGIHVSAWHRIAGGKDQDSGYEWARSIGYTRINNMWSIALRDWSHDGSGDVDQTTYTFGEAPPWMCLEAAGKIPELLVELIDRTQEMRAQITSKTAEVKELAAVLKDLATEVAAAR